jgi:drug/metabolite transporter (DMT)-like permease
VTALGLGLVAAIVWGASALVSARAARADGPLLVLATYLVVGAVVSVLAGLATGLPNGTAADWGWSATTGAVIVAGSLMWLAAVEHGKLSIVTPIVATDGAIAALISIGTGERLDAAVGAALGVIAAGIVLACVRQGVTIHGRGTARTVAIALVAAALFGTTFVTGAQPEQLSAVWVVAVARLAALVLVVPAVLVRGRYRPSRAAAPWAAGMGALDAGGYVAFVEGTRSSLAVASVVASQYAVVAVLGGLLFFRERVTRVQLAGVALTLAGVTALAALEA